MKNTAQFMYDFMVEGRGVNTETGGSLLYHHFYSMEWSLSEFDGPMGELDVLCPSLI